jgi:hypothetical protein
MPKTSQPSPRVLASRRNGALGGKARAKKYSRAERDEWSSKGGLVTSELYGPDLARHRFSKRKTVGRYRKPAAECITRKHKAKSRNTNVADKPKISRRKAITYISKAA